MKKTLGMAAAMMLAYIGLPACTGGSVASAGSAAVGAIEVPVVAAVETRFAVICGSLESDAEPRTAEQLANADAGIDREYAVLAVARASYDALALVRPASAGTLHLVFELRTASDAAYRRAKARLAERLAEARVAPATPI